MYQLTEEAIRDIEGLLERSLTEFGMHCAEQYFNSLKHCFELLAENPAMGRSAEELLPNYFRFPHKSHVIFYKILPADTTILIVRVLHESMDIKRHLKAGK